MENASKALLIAGAIILAIVLISLGMYVFGIGSNAVKNGGIDEAEVLAFNEKFYKYEGAQRGSVVKTLKREAEASNASDTNQGNAARLDISGLPTTISATKMYTVTIETDPTTGYINKISAEEK